MLKRLEISGFKSFAKKSVLDFKTPISAIVGPNGSGKSNVAEAFRFVLGEQSLKSMRGKRGEDLIFSGSKSERPMNRASVKVVFDNSKKTFDLDYDEISIERIVHRDGVNQYFLNNSQVRLKDITELLAMANIGASGHHIISQGEADKILNVNPKERRGIIEEALGLKVYQYKIAESEKKLEKTEENIKSVQSLRREVAPHLKFLKKQVQKIEQAFELKNSLRILYKEYFKREDLYLKHNKEYIQKNKHPLSEELKRLDAELFEAKEILRKEKEGAENSSVVLELNEKLKVVEEKLKQLRIQEAETGRKIGQIEGMISFEEKRIAREEALKKAGEDRMIRFGQVRQFTNEIDECLAKYSGDELVRKIKEIVSNFISRNENAQPETLHTSGEDLINLKVEKNEAENKLADIQGTIEVVIIEAREIKQQIENQKEINRQAEIRIFEINAKISEVKAKLNSILDLENRISIEDESFKKELNEAFIMVGRDSIQFFDFEVKDKDGNILDKENIVSENRGGQRERQREIEKIKIKLEDMGSSGSGEDVMKEYKETEARDEFLGKEITDLENSAQSLKNIISELKEKLDKEFKEGTEKINKQFNEFFITMFGGGGAELLLVKNTKKKKKDVDIEEGEISIDETDDQQEGIEVEVSLPNKKTKGLQMLSGGERSLTSIALLFAMSQIKPPPFIILDETDAALDEANSRRYGDMITNLSDYSQLILITHNRETMSRAGVLYGVTIGGDGISKLLSIQLEEAIKVAK